MAKKENKKKLFKHLQQIQIEKTTPQINPPTPQINEKKS
jgi:hypothetical protein